MNIKAAVETAATRRYLREVARKQIPFATARALTWTARDVAKDCGEELHKFLDRPTPFTQKAFIGTKAKKTHLVAYVQIKDIQAGYLQYQIRGGKRLPQRKAIGVPTENQKRNPYGNLPRGEIKKLLANPNNFSGTVHGVAGIWQRGHYSKKGKWSQKNKSKSTAVRLLVAWEPKATYRKRYPFRRRVRILAARRYPENFRRSFAQAMESAR